MATTRDRACLTKEEVLVLRGDHEAEASVRLAGHPLRLRKFTIIFVIVGRSHHGVLGMEVYLARRGGLAEHNVATSRAAAHLEPDVILPFLRGDRRLRNSSDRGWTLCIMIVVILLQLKLRASLIIVAAEGREELLDSELHAVLAPPQYLVQITDGLRIVHFTLKKLSEFRLGVIVVE